MTRMLPRLVAVAGPLAGNSLLLSREETSVGRDAANDLVIADASVAPHHCVLARVGGRVTVRDRDRRNPTFVNGLPGGDRPIVDGDEIQIGDSLFVVRLVTDQPGPADLVRIEETPTPLSGMI